MRKRLLSLSIVSLAVLSACSSSTELPPAAQTSVRAGSSLTFVREITDTAWVEVERTDSIVYSVASIDTTYRAQTQAHFVWAPDDTVVYRTDLNGDITFYQPEIAIPNTGLAYPEWWTVLPVMTKQA